MARATKQNKQNRKQYSTDYESEALALAARMGMSSCTQIAAASYCSKDYQADMKESERHEAAALIEQVRASDWPLTLLRAWRKVRAFAEAAAGRFAIDTIQHRIALSVHATCAGRAHCREGWFSGTDPGTNFRRTNPDQRVAHADGRHPGCPTGGRTSAGIRIRGLGTQH